MNKKLNNTYLLALALVLLVAPSLQESVLPQLNFVFGNLDYSLEDGIQPRTKILFRCLQESSESFDFGYIIDVMTDLKEATGTENIDGLTVDTSKCKTYAEASDMSKWNKDLLNAFSGLTYVEFETPMMLDGFVLSDFFNGSVFDNNTAIDYLYLGLGASSGIESIQPFLDTFDKSTFDKLSFLDLTINTQQNMYSNNIPYSELEQFYTLQKDYQPNPYIYIELNYDGSCTYFEAELTDSEARDCYPTSANIDSLEIEACEQEITIEGDVLEYDGTSVVTENSTYEWKIFTYAEDGETENDLTSDFASDNETQDLVISDASLFDLNTEYYVRFSVMNPETNVVGLLKVSSCPPTPSEEEGSEPEDDGDNDDEDEEDKNSSSLNLRSGLLAICLILLALI